MARKKKQSLESGEFDLDDLEGLGDFNFGEVDSQTDPEARKKDRHPVSNAFKGSIKGAKDTILDPALMRRVGREVFPKQYGEVADNVGETFSTVSALYNDAVREVKPAAGKVAKQIDKLVPAEYARTKKLTGKLAKMFGVEEETSRDQGPSREEAVLGEIGRLFAMQSEGDDQNRAEDKAEGLAKDEIERQRFESNTSVLSSIASNVARLSTYNDKINLAYQKKSLELQYRSMFAQTDLLDTSKKFFEIFKAQNDAITKNTGLPDYVKLKNSERAMDFARNKFMGTIGNSLFGNGAFIRNGLENIKKAAGAKIKGMTAAFSAASMGLDEIQGARDQAAAFEGSGVEMPGMAELGGNMAGSMGAEYLAGKLGKMARNKFVKPGGRIDRLGYKASTMTMDAASMTRRAMNSEMLKDAEFEGGLKGYGKRALKSGLGLLLGGGTDMSLDTGKGIGDAREDARFDNRTQTSITTVIPGYLGRILREVKILRTGDSNQAMEVYDYGKSGFLSMEASRAGVKERAINAYNSKGYDYGLKWGVSNIKGDEKLSDAAEKALRNRMRKHSRSNDSLTAEGLFSNDLYEGLDPAVAAELKAFAEKKYGDGSVDKEKNRHTLAKELKDLKSRIPDIRADVQSMVNAGYIDQLTDLGIITKTSRGYSIDFEKYSQIVGMDAEGEGAEEEPKAASGYNFGTSPGGRRRRPFGNRKGFKNEAPITVIRERPSPLPPITPTPARPKPLEEGEAPRPTHADSELAPIVKGIKSDTAAILEKLGGIQANTSEFKTTIQNFDMKGALDALGNKLSGAATSAKESGKEAFNKLKTAAGEYAPQAKTYWGAAKEIGHLGIGLAVGLTKDAFKRLKGSAIKFNESVLQPGGAYIKDFYNKYKQPVMDFSKNVLASGMDLTISAFNRAKGIVTDLVTNKLPAGYALLKKYADSAKDKVLNLLDKPIDIYVEGNGMKDPVLSAITMRAGGYFDQVTGKVISRPSQIKGPVVNDKGEVVLTEADVKMGLVDQYGEKIKTPWQKLIAGAIAIGKNALGNIMEKLPMLGSLGKKFADTLNNMFGGMVAGLTGGAKKRLAVLIQIRDLLNARLPGKRSKFEDLDTMFRKSAGNSGLRSENLGVVGAVTAGYNKAKDKASGLYNKAKDKYQAPETQEKIQAAKDKAKEKATEAKDKAKALKERLKEKYLSKETQDKIQTGKDKVKGFGKKAGMMLAGTLVPTADGGVMDRIAQALGGSRNFNQDKKEERKGSWKQIAADREKKNEYRNAHRDRNLASKDLRYKSSENVIDMMIRKAKEMAAKKEGLMDEAGNLLEDLPDGEGGQPKTRRELAKERLKRMKAAKAAKTGGKMGKVGRALGSVGRGVGNVLNKGGMVGRGLLKTGQAIGKVGGVGINAARAVGTPLLRGAGAVGNVATKIPGVARVAGAARVLGTVGRVGLMAGSMMLPGTGGAIMGALGMAGSAIMAAVSSPVVLGAAAIGLAAYGGYKAYQYFTRNNTEDFSKIRLMQYGFGEKEKDQVYKALQMESYLVKEAVGYDSGKAYLIEKKIDSDKLIDFFSVDKENKEHVEKFVSWFTNRFKPFFLTHLTALFAVDNKAKLDDVEKLDPDKKLQYLKAAAFENGPYDATISPFEGKEPLSVTKKQVMDAIAIVKAKVEKEQKSKGKKKDKKDLFTLSGKGAAIGALAGAALGGPIGAAAGAVIGAVAPNFKTQAINAMKLTGSIIAAPFKFIADKSISVTKMMGYNLTALMSIRFKCYGLIEAEHIRSSVLYGLERYVAKSVTYEKDGSAHYKQDLAQVLKECGGAFGVASIEDKRSAEWITWFNRRFLPVFLKFMAMGHQRTNKKDPEEIETVLKDSQKYDIGISLSGTDGIWNVKESPFRDYAVGLDKAVVDPNLNFLKEKVKEEKVKEEALAAAAKKAAPAPVKKPEPKPPVVKPPKDTSSYHEVEPTVGKDDNKTGGEDGTSGVGGQKIPSADGPMADPSAGDQYINKQKGVTLGGVQENMLNNFRAMAAEYGQKTGKVVGVNSGFRSYDKQMELYRQDPSKAAKPGRSLHEFGLAIDAQPANLDEMDKLGLMRKYGFTRPVGGEPWHMEPAGIQVNIAKAKEDPQFAAEAVRASEGVGGGGVGAIPGSSKGKRDTKLALSNMNIDASTAPKATNDNKGSVSDAFMARAKTNENKDAKDAQVAKTMERTAPKGDNGRFDINTAGKAYASSAAASVGTLQETNKKQGNFEETQDAEPGGLGKAKAMSAGNAGVAATIDSAARATGMDPTVMKTFAAVESGMDPSARADGSSATGLFQFTRRTWNEVTSKYGSKYGISSSTPPTDPKASALMAGEYLKQNSRVIDDVKPQPNATDLYLTHFLGPGGAKRFLSNNPGAPGAAALPTAAAANHDIFYKGGQPLSLGQIYSGLSTKLKKRAKEFGIDANLASGAVKGGGDSGSDDTGGSGGPAMPPPKKRAYAGQTNSGRFQAPSTPASTPSLSSSAPSAGAASSATSTYVEQPQKPGVASSEESLSKVSDTLEESLDVQKKLLAAFLKLTGQLTPEELAKAMPNIQAAIDNGVKADDPSSIGKVPTNTGTARGSAISRSSAALPEDGVSLDRRIVA